MISKLFLDNNFEGYSVVNSPDNAIDNLSQINIFIGENNSGKSRFLRTIFKVDDYIINFNGFSFLEIHKILQYGINEMLVILTSHSLSDFSMQWRNSHVDMVDFLKGMIKIMGVKYNSADVFKNALAQLKDIADVHHVVKVIPNPSARSYVDLNQSQRIDLCDIVMKLYDKIYAKTKDFVLIEHDKTYIPILRGLRPIQRSGIIPDNSYDTQFSHDDGYTLRTQKDYLPFIVGNKYNVFTGLTLYEEIKKNLLNNVDKRNLIRDFEIFLSETFFNGAKISLIPHVNNDVLHIGIDDNEKEIFNLGDGIQALIILLYPLFINRGKNMIFCIEEPENHLHPGMQRIFLEALQKKEFSTFQYFITTHSNHFLDLTLDMSHTSVYTFKKKKDVFEIENVSNDTQNILELIGARASSVFLSNCTIWVEGVTDRLYIKKYFELYQKEQFKNEAIPKIYLEDIHYSFVEYGGNNITHWSFLDDDSGINVERLCSTLFLITDNDGAKEAGKAAKKERFDKLQKNLGDRYYCLQVREIENLIPKESLKKYIKKKEKDNPALSFTNFDKKDYHNATTQLGEFIEKNVSGLKYKYQESKKSKTIGNKIEVCKGVLEYLDENMAVIPEVTELCKKLYEFVRKNNS